MRLFLDANVLFSATYSTVGRAAALLRLSEIGRCVLLASPHVIEEATRNIRVKVPEKSADLATLIELMERVPEAPPKIVEWAAAKGLPDKDAPVLAAAVAGRADLLVTGDRTHFGHLFGKEFGGVTVSSLRGALETVLERSDE